jgi:hypothetical protein
LGWKASWPEPKNERRKNRDESEKRKVFDSPMPVPERANVDLCLSEAFRGIHKLGLALEGSSVPLL